MVGRTKISCTTVVLLCLGSTSSLFWISQRSLELLTLLAVNYSSLYQKGLCFEHEYAQLERTN